MNGSYASVYQLFFITVLSEQYTAAEIQHIFAISATGNQENTWRSTEGEQHLRLLLLLWNSLSLMESAPALYKP